MRFRQFLLAASALAVLTPATAQQAPATDQQPVKVVTVPDSYPQAELETAMSGQDVVLNCITSLSTGEQFRFVDAALASGVKRYVPSEYGLDNGDPAPRIHRETSSQNRTRAAGAEHQDVGVHRLQRRICGRSAPACRSRTTPVHSPAPYARSSRRFRTR